MVDKVQVLGLCRLMKLSTRNETSIFDKVGDAINFLFLPILPYCDNKDTTSCSGWVGGGSSEWYA